MAQPPTWDASAFWKEQSFQTSARLHLQHWIFTYQLGYLLHPKIGADGEPLKIADVACGNAAWLLDVARQYPQHDYHGFDITPAHFVHAANLPANVHLHTWDAFGELPSELVGEFDIVDIRTIYSAVIDNNVEPLLDNLLKMLKPGGCLQWAENDASTLTAHAPQDVKADATATLVNLQNFFSRFHSKLLPDWLHGLASSLGQRGCEVLVDETLTPRSELARAWSDNMLTVSIGVPALLPEQAIPLPPVPGLPESVSRQSYGDLVFRAAAESSQGAWSAMDQRIVVARKSA
ncbi:hypothetical protein LTR53_012644 [Teratosphaeriaceae sp. CCFEE 6253]|nr:hypothetical protein LTR53_012644 [Teratosphaeriaceae sp. CCFEE 6253]